jgi:HEAT repeat protein
LDVAAARAMYASADEEARRDAILGLEPTPPDLSAALEFLIDAMGDPSWRVRKAAAQRTTDLAERPAVARAVVAALAEPDNVGRRNALIETLLGIGGAAVGPLTEALAARPEHRKVLVDTLGLLADPGGAAAVEPLLDDPDPNVRVAAAEALGQIGGARAQEALRGVLARDERLLVLAALDGLNRLGARIAVADLAPLVDVTVLRAPALAALGRSGDPAAAPLLLRSLEAPARSVAEAAMRGLVDLWQRLDDAARAQLAPSLALTPPADSQVVQALLEGTPPVRRAAALLLGISGNIDAVRPLALTLADPQVRDVAEEAITRLGPAAAEALLDLAPDFEPRVRGATYGVLARLFSRTDPRRIESLLEAALADDDPDAAAAAADALGELGGGAPKSALVALMRAIERDDDAAPAAVEALGRIGRARYDEVKVLIADRGLEGRDGPALCRVLGMCGRADDLPSLRVALGAESAAVRRAAAEALAALDVPAQAAVREALDEALVWRLADEVPEVRAAAARALGAHRRAEALEALERAAADVELAVATAATRAIGELARAASSNEARQRALAVLRRLVDGGEVVAVPALEALGPVGDPADDERLARALHHGEVEIVKAAARALGTRRGALSARVARLALEEALEDPRWDVRRQAALALGQHGPDAHPRLYARRGVETDALVLEAIDEALESAIALPSPPRGPRG